MTETLHKEEALFIPGQETARDEYIPKVAGEYLGHLIEARTVTREFTREGRLMKARIFNFKIRVAAENRTQKYTFQDKDGNHRDITGEHFIDWEMVADGVFRYLEPTREDSFESYAEGNKKYLLFCQSLGMEIPTEERTVNGNTVSVQLLPDIDEKMLNGTPVVAVVGRGKDWINDKGETVPSWRCKFIKRWTEGKKLAMDTTNDDLPF
tara:strand:+ start:685 stop:1311 length:627 start_codon:yes stop_codon:yes gene_type:complete